MTVYNELNKIAYIGNTSQTLYPIPFEYINTEDIKVSIYTSKNEFVEDWRYSTQYVIEGGNVKVLSGYAIDKNKKLLILRRVDLVQDNKYREGGDFPAKSTETSFDKLTMITQQLQETLDRCVKVEVLDVQSPEQLLADVYSKLDSATEVAEQAIGAANQATTAAKNANDAVVVAQQQITETQAFIEQARADINQTVEDSIEYVEQEAVKAATEVVGEVVGQYTDRAETAAKNAEADASRTAESANQASASANSAATSASEAEAIAGEVSVYNFKNKITNCITEIPQDIKLELNNGTLTLKKGSKVYVPNGVGKFDEVIVSSDKVISVAINESYIVAVNPGDLSIQLSALSSTGSGTSTPTTSGAMYYNTNDNKVYRIASSGGAYEVSLPIAIISGSGVISSIDQVFNGFGYIGSTVFALPGVKGLIPDGRNADGSLRNKEVVLDRVYIAQTSESYGQKGIAINGSGIESIANWAETKLETDGKALAKTSPWMRVFCYDTNKVFVYTGSGFLNQITGFVGLYSATATGITSFTPKLPFRAADQNDFNKLDEEVVKTSGAQTIAGTKTFTNAPKIVNTSGKNIHLLLSDTTANSEIGLMQATSNGKNQFLIYFANGNKYPFVISQDPSDNTKFSFNITSAPAATSNTAEIATTAWVTSNGTKNSFKPNWAGKVSITRGTDYTAPSNGFIVFYASDWNKNTSIKINSTELFKFYGNVISGTMGCIPVCKGDVVNITGGGTGNNDIYCPTYFIPFK